MQARSRWLMFFLAVIALLVVAIWPRSEPTESHSPTRPQMPPAASQDDGEASRPELHICDRSSEGFLPCGPGGTARERKTPGNQSDVSWREH